MGNQVRIKPKSFAVYLFFVSMLSVVIFWIHRAILYTRIPANEKPNEIYSIVFQAAKFDFSFLIYSFSWLVAYFLVVSYVSLNKKFQSRVLTVFSTIYFFVILFSSVIEFYFWEEFHSRFNFIAVDYLMYPNEVLKNMWESYPVLWAITGCLIFGYIISLALIKTVKFQSYDQIGYKYTVALILLFPVLISANYKIITESNHLNSSDPYKNEISKNTLFAFFHAYRSNRIDYVPSYIQLPREVALNNTKLLLGISDKKSENLMRAVRFKNNTATKKNIIIVIMESISANYMRAYGNQGNLTPNLDQIAKEGLFFKNIFATGTRTVRGIEAITLSVPPSPGPSILRRLNNEGLYNIGTVFREKGYRTSFYYGGYASFDNMRYFFEKNRFEVLDRSSLRGNEITHSNAWGVCDEDLFDFVLRESDRATNEGKSFFKIILTTSNHSPYTFPVGKVDLAQGTREGALKYSDYAIGQLIQKSKAKTWFKDTIFIFVSDHNATVSGGKGLPVSDFKIPLIYYNPGFLPSISFDILGSQIDVGPTLMEILNHSYISKFFGHSLLSSSYERAFIATYDKLGYLEKNDLVVLAPDQKYQKFSNEGQGWTATQSVTRFDPKNSIGDVLLLKAVSLYQTAADQFLKGYLKE